MKQGVRYAQKKTQRFLAAFLQDIELALNGQIARPRLSIFAYTISDAYRF